MCGSQLQASKRSPSLLKCHQDHHRHHHHRYHHQCTPHASAACLNDRSAVGLACLVIGKSGSCNVLLPNKHRVGEDSAFSELISFVFRMKKEMTSNVRNFVSSTRASKFPVSNLC